MRLPLAQLIAMHVALAAANGHDLPGPSYLEEEMLDQLDTERADAKLEKISRGDAEYAEKADV